MCLLRQFIQRHQESRFCGVIVFITTRHSFLPIILHSPQILGFNSRPSLKAEDVLKNTIFNNLFTVEEANRALKKCYKML
ncbi:unnamed protein product [Clavelina lepadiformis]|uniref:Uncharacterized protein n=1 Tax=Clavelina lepadiformis TaxID=159417 RepID=A0ABP0G7L9_CLALP